VEAGNICQNLLQSVLSVAKIWLIGGKLLAELIESSMGTQTVSGAFRARASWGFKAETEMLLVR
jgi:hypothetical protein